MSFDVNYRALLWSPQRAAEVLEPMLKQCDMVFCAHRDAMNLFAADSDSWRAARHMHERLGCGTFVLTLGEDGAIAVQRNAQGAHDEMHQPQNFKVSQFVDRIGAGDAFDAGFIAAQMWGYGLKDALNYGNALSALKISIPGDMSLFSRDELEALVGGARSASVR